MRKFIGYSILILLFGGLFIVLSIKFGSLLTLLVTLGSCAFTALIYQAVVLIVE